MTEDKANLEFFISRCLRDTGYLARNLLGYDYDETGDQEKINEGVGGIRPEGSHQQMVELLDDRLKKFILIEAPRGSYKSTILQAFCIRVILLNPDIRIFYVARTDPMAKEKSVAIRDQMMRPEVTQLFGSQIGTPWEETRWTVSSRKAVGLMNATFQSFSMDSMPTGGRANIVILDDFIDDTNCTNPEQIQKAKEKFHKIQPFVAKGGRLIVVGTRWGHDDIYSEIEGNPRFAPPDGGQLILGAGVRVVSDKNGVLDLEEEDGGLTFPHLSMDMLRDKLHLMSQRNQFFHFSCQYLNHVPSGTGTMFQRRMFKPLRWGEDMKELSGYLLTDTAVSQEDEGCHSVVAYVCIDAHDNIYLMDLRVGHWTPGEFVNVFFDVLETWQPKVNHCGEAWEHIALSTVFRHTMETDSRSRRTRLRTIEIPRYSANSKNLRIQRLYMPMSQGRFFVVNTVPNTFEDLDGTKDLWSAEGYYDARTKSKLPAGELVEQFVKWPTHPKNDIADTLGMILEYQKRHGHHRRYCRYRPYNPPPKRSTLTAERKREYDARDQNPGQERGGDWWDRTLRDHGF